MQRIYRIRCEDMSIDVGETLDRSAIFLNVAGVTVYLGKAQAQELKSVLPGYVPIYDASRRELEIKDDEPEAGEEQAA